MCDVYDAITSNRPYKSGWDPAESIAQMAERLRVFRSCPLITPKRARSSLQMLAIAQAMAVLVRPAWARSSGCKSPAELAAARQVKRNCARVTERGEEAMEA